jgi:hypothetical protein
VKSGAAVADCTTVPGFRCAQSGLQADRLTGPRPRRNGKRGLCESLLSAARARYPPAFGVRKHTAPNRANYRDKFERNESFDIGSAIALPGLIPPNVRGRQPVTPTDGAGAVPAGGGSSLPLSGDPGIDPAGITTGARGALLKRDAEAEVTPSRSIA